jgi:hypothetical protein
MRLRNSPYLSYFKVDESIDTVRHVACWRSYLSLLERQDHSPAGDASQREGDIEATGTKP